MANPLESLMAVAQGGGAPAPEMPAEAGGISTDTQKLNANMMDAPIPGQSLTREQGSTAWEQPPEFNTENEAMDFLFEKVTRQETQTNLLRVMDAGVPISILMEPILMHGVQEGKWSMDLAMALMEPLGVVLYGMGKSAGVNPKLDVEKKKGGGLNPEPLAKIFKKEVAKRKEAVYQGTTKSKGLLSRPEGAK